MLTRVQRWGNSLGLRIPKSFAEEAGVEAGSPVDIALEDGELVVRPIRPRKYDLLSLIQGINAKNIHEAIDAGAPVGREVW